MPNTLALLVLIALFLLPLADARAEPAPLDARTVDATVRQLDRRGGGRGGVRARGKRGWGLALEGLWVHQLATDLDDGGRFHVNRAALRANVSYSPKPGMPITLSLGYRYDGYQFRSGGVFDGAPWGDVHSLRATVPVFLPLGERWFAIGGLFVRSTVEDGARLDDGLTAGGFAGASYRVSDRLSIGPGFGIVGELEDDPSFFPVVVVDWKITPTLAFKTGRGLGATQGPGLFLEWTPSPRWQFSLGGRYDRNRFRLNNSGLAPGGIGQETAFALLVAAQVALRDNLDLSANVGTSFLGNLRLETERGDFLQSTDYDITFFVGLGINVRF